MEKIVIVGGVAAGATAAAKARRLSPTAEITMIEAGADISFANCGLPYYIGGDIDSRSKLILQSPESFKDQYNVQVFTHTTVTKIDRANNAIEVQNTQNRETRKISYTKLILAQGGRPITPKLAGAEKEHVFTLWTLQDMDEITSFISDKQPKNAVVVGGGFIGLEMAEALVKRDLTVSVVEKMPHVMALMEAETAGFIEREMLSYGVNLHTNTGVTEIKDKTVILDNGKEIEADMVLMSIGVRPTLQLAQESGLAIGEVGGLLVDEYLQTSDPNIYAAGDMVEISNRVNRKKVRIPLAGPANRQGRIAAENALGGKHSYKGSIGTSVVRVFEAVAGITGLSLKQARNLGMNADAVVVHKESFTSYYPGSKPVSIMLIYDKDSGVVLGGQTAGYIGADKRLDVIATATATGLKVSELADIDFAYSPPIGTANDALNMAAYVAENKMSNYSPSILASELDEYIKEKQQLIVIDLRDVFAFEKSHIEGAVNVPLELLSENIARIPKDVAVIVYDETGKKGHQALRTLMGAGIKDVVNISGGHTSLQRHAITVGFETIQLDLLPIDKKSLEAEEKQETQNEEASIDQQATDQPIIIDVRTAGEFQSGAYPNAVNICLDEIMAGDISKIGNNLDREIIVYCASGARSAYAQQILRQKGYTKVENGGGLAMMMSRR